VEEARARHGKSHATELGDHVRGGAEWFGSKAAANATSLVDHRVQPQLHQLIGGDQPGDSGTDDSDLGSELGFGDLTQTGRVFQPVIKGEGKVGPEGGDNPARVRLGSHRRHGVIVGCLAECQRAFGVEVAGRADGLFDRHIGCGVDIGDSAPGSGAVVGAQRAEPNLGAIRIVHDGVRLDGDCASVGFCDRGSRYLIDGLLDIGGLVAVGGRFCRVEAESMLGQEATVGAHQTKRPLIVTQRLHHGRNRVGYVVVQRTAGKGQAPGLGELAIFAQPQALGTDLHC